MRTPLAWQNLTHNPRRLVVAVSGVAFAVILIFMELGFLNALLESTVQVLRRLNGDIIILSKAEYALIAAERFDIHRLAGARAFPGVASVSPLYIENAALLRTGHDRGYPIRVLAVQENDPALNFTPFQEQRDDLHAENTALADTASRRKFKFPRPSGEGGKQSLPGDGILASYGGELNGRKLRLVGHFHLGVDFATDGNLLMTTSNFARYFPDRAGGDDPLKLVDLAVVRLEPGANVNTVLSQLAQTLPPDVQALSKQQLIDHEKKFWQQNAPLGYIFMVGAVMGFVVGVVICYQIVYADIADHMREFATLKAIGYGSTYFFGLVLEQCLYLSLFGFLPGLVISYLTYRFLAAYTGLTMHLQPTLALVVLLTTAAMCTLSGLLAVTKLLSSDPAELF
jgi:putative ABC transport system permease protein